MISVQIWGDLPLRDASIVSLRSLQDMRARDAFGENVRECSCYGRKSESLWRSQEMQPVWKDTIREEQPENARTWQEKAPQIQLLLKVIVGDPCEGHSKCNYRWKDKKRQSEEDWYYINALQVQVEKPLQCCTCFKSSLLGMAIN